MSHARPDPASEPIRTAESEVAAYQWDGWRDSAAAAFVHIRRTALVVSIVIGIVVGTVGLVWLPGAAKVSAALYTPVVAWAAWSAAYRWPAGRSLRTAVDGVRSLVVPALLDTVDASTRRRSSRCCATVAPW